MEKNVLAPAIAGAREECCGIEPIELLAVSRKNVDFPQGE
jgi:hypothetical protein